MRASGRVFFVVLATVFLLGSRLFAADAPVSLTAPSGAAVTFTEGPGGWTWTSFTIPGQVDVQMLDELGYQITTPIADEQSPAAAGWSLVERSATRLVFEHAFPKSGVALRRVYSFGPADNVLRLETWAAALGDSTVINHLSLLSAHFLGQAFRETGIPNQSFPLFGPKLFAGIEHVSGEAHAWAEVGYLAQSPHLAVDAEWKFVAAVVVGWPFPGQDVTPGMAPIRAAFLRYLDTVRLKPANMELHTNTWWTLPLPFSEADVIRDIDALKSGFYDRTGMFFDSYALDLGWSDRHSVWKVDAQRFPDGLQTIHDRLQELGCKLGLWASPGSAYPEGLDNAWLKSNGYEVTPFDAPEGVVACFAAGNRYQRELRDNLVGYARQYGLGHVKLDFMAHTCDVPEHGHPTGPSDSSFAIDAGLADVLDSLRAVNPSMALEPLVCGNPPSPWWTMHTPYLLGPAGDDVPFGRSPCPEWMESLITGRDTAYRRDQEQWLMPTQALETFDIVVQCPGDFKNMAVMAIGRGRWFISTYLKPAYMQPEDWDFLAGLVRWARANKEILANAQMIGGSPEKRVAYGYLFHAPDRDVYCVRNPWMEYRTIDLPIGANVTATRDFRMLYPRHATLTRVAAGTATYKFTLAPYETAIIESIPTDPKRKIIYQPSRPKATVTAATPQWLAAGSGARYVWDGTIDMPVVADSELCVLVQGDATVKNTTGTITIDGEDVAFQTTGNAGQFAAAGGQPAENWTWLRVPLPAGSHSVRFDLSIPMKSATIGLYVRGKMAATHDATWTDAAPFPEMNPLQRPWSQTVTSAKAYLLKATKAAK